MSNINTVITTLNGNIIDLLKIKSEDIKLEDISLPLAKIPCYLGGSLPSYSIAQHSLNCSKVAREKYDERMGLYLLLHDAKNAYIKSATESFEKSIVEVRLLEKNIDKAIYNHFGLEYPGFGFGYSARMYMERINEIDCGIIANEIPIIMPECTGLIPREMLPFPVELDFNERTDQDVKEEYEDTVNYLVKKI